MEEFFEQARSAVLLALQKEIGDGDVTSLATIPREMQTGGRFLAKAGGIIAGLVVAALTYCLLKEELSADFALPNVPFSPCVEEGAAVNAATVAASAFGPAQLLLTAERGR